MTAKVQIFLFFSHQFLLLCNFQPQFKDEGTDFWPSYSKKVKFCLVKVDDDKKVCKFAKSIKNSLLNQNCLSRKKIKRRKISIIFFFWKLSIICGFFRKVKISESKKRSVRKKCFFSGQKRTFSNCFLFNVIWRGEFYMLHYLWILWCRIYEGDV